MEVIFNDSSPTKNKYLLYDYWFQEIIYLYIDKVFAHLIAFAWSYDWLKS